MEHPEVNFYPWCGTNYGNAEFYGKKIKLLILGESHYGFKNNQHNATKNTVLKYLGRIPTNGNDNYHWKSFFTKIAKICRPKKKVSKQEVHDFWDSVLFYNYLNKSLKKRNDGKEKLWKTSEDDFFKVLNYYKPDVMLILGDALWNNTPQEGWTLDKKNLNLGWYTLLTGEKIYASSIYHPSCVGKCYGNKQFNSFKIFKTLIKEYSK